MLIRWMKLDKLDESGFPAELKKTGSAILNFWKMQKGRLSVLENSLSLKYVFPSFDNEAHLVSHSVLDAWKYKRTRSKYKTYLRI